MMVMLVVMLVMGMGIATMLDVARGLEWRRTEKGC
jgi:hypothetical protein